MADFESASLDRDIRVICIRTRVGMITAGLKSFIYSIHLFGAGVIGVPLGAITVVSSQLTVAWHFATEAIAPQGPRIGRGGLARREWTLVERPTARHPSFVTLT